MFSTGRKQWEANFGGEWVPTMSTVSSTISKNSRWITTGAKEMGEEGLRMAVQGIRLLKLHDFLYTFPSKSETPDIADVTGVPKIVTFDDVTTGRQRVFMYAYVYDMCVAEFVDPFDLHFLGEVSFTVFLVLHQNGRKLTG